MEKKPVQTSSIKQPSILLVDDDRLVLLTVANGLRKAGYEVLEASSSVEAIAICETQLPDLAIFDVRMPGKSGIDAAQELAAKYDLPFMIFSAYSDQNLVDEAIERGALSYLIKPLDVIQLTPVIEVALQRAKDIKSLKEAEFHLNRALNSGRDTSAAVGILMERFQVTGDDAFELLRSYARSNRRKVADVAADVLSATEQVNLLRKP
jgi:AmiR/NasT family two-component response regulator